MVAPEQAVTLPAQARPALSAVPRPDDRQHAGFADQHPRTPHGEDELMSETLTDSTEHDSTTPGADEATATDAVHGRHRGVTAPDDTSEADPHGRHRR
ncbi:hypothetical protein P3T29_000590 [Kitasatospora sp. MAP5-34]|nr:hypothetical protein [Kitasatospora sp. MAP5-34]